MANPPNIPGMPPPVIPAFPIAGVRPTLINPHSMLMMPSMAMGLGAMPGMPFGMDIQTKPYQKPVSVADMKVATTVFVGNITEKATDSLVRQILLRCGYIVGWKRVQNATGKLQAFGFCEYADPESTLRAMRLLNNFTLGDKSLVVKVDSKNRNELLRYLVRKQKLKTEEDADETTIEREVNELLAKEGDKLEQDVDDETKEEDRKVIAAINGLVRENVDVLSGTKTSDDFRREKDVHESLVAMAKQSGRIDEDSTLDDVDMEDDMKTLVSDEIKRFRLSYQNYEEKQMEARMRRQQARLEEKEKGDAKKDIGTDRSRSRSPKKITGRSKSPKTKRSPRTRSQERREREKERELRKKEEKERVAKEEEEHERKQLERKRQEREKIFKDRLRQWEVREKRKIRDYEYDLEEEEARRAKLEKEKKCLAEFLEDYDDDKHDHKYYRGSEYARRHDDRMLELEEDEQDRKREKEEIESLRLEVMERQIKEMAEEQERKKREAEAQRSHGNQIKTENEDNEIDMMTEIDKNVPLVKQEYQQPFPPIQVQAAPTVHAPTIKPEIKSDPNEPTSTDIVPYDDDNKASPLTITGTKLTFGINKKQQTATTTTRSTVLEGVFGGEEEDTENSKPKKKLYTLMSSSGSAHFTAAMAEVPPEGKMTAEDRKKLIQSLVNSIPSRREELFNWDLKWNYIDQTLMEKRVSPWINKKIVEYIGEPEPTLTDFICNKLAEKVSPESILNDIAMVLDDEAEVFVLKLWRLLIYETEAKHLGIAKNY